MKVIDIPLEENQSIHQSMEMKVNENTFELQKEEISNCKSKEELEKLKKNIFDQLFELSLNRDTIDNNNAEELEELLCLIEQQKNNI